jgi:hypothetical protein
VENATTCSTPLICFALAASKLFNFAPKRGGCRTTAVSMPGSLTSCVKIALPFDFARASVRAAGLPMRTKSLGSFSLTSVGTGCFAASAASSPKVALLSFDETMPRETPISAAGTCHFSAAAATSMARAAAPALRNCS